MAWRRRCRSKEEDDKGKGALPSWAMRMLVGRCGPRGEREGGGAGQAGWAARGAGHARPRHDGLRGRWEEGRLGRLGGKENGLRPRVGRKGEKFYSFLGV